MDGNKIDQLLAGAANELRNNLSTQNASIWAYNGKIEIPLKYLFSMAVENHFNKYCNTIYKDCQLMSISMDKQYPCPTRNTIVEEDLAICIQHKDRSHTASIEFKSLLSINKTESKKDSVNAVIQAANHRNTNHKYIILLASIFNSHTPIKKAPENIQLMHKKAIHKNSETFNPYDLYDVQTNSTLIDTLDNLRDKEKKEIKKSQFNLTANLIRANKLRIASLSNSVQNPIFENTTDSKVIFSLECHLFKLELS